MSIISNIFYTVKYSNINWIIIKHSSSFSFRSFRGCFRNFPFIFSENNLFPIPSSIYKLFNNRSNYQLLFRTFFK